MTTLTVIAGRKQFAVEASLHYTGTQTGGSGSPNIETYNATFPGEPLLAGVVLEAWWRGSALEPTYVTIDRTTLVALDDNRRAAVVAWLGQYGVKLRRPITA